MNQPGNHSQHYPIDKVAQIRLLASPVRQEVIDALQAAGPCSMSELAELLGRPADALYFHVRRLVRTGLVIEVANRKSGRHVAAMYDVPARPMLMDYRITRHPKGCDAVSAVVRGALKLSIREFEGALREGRRMTVGSGRSLWGGRAKGWLTRDEQIEVTRLLESLTAIFHNARPRKGAAAMALGFVLSPCRVGRRHRAVPLKPKATRDRRRASRSTQ